MPIPDPLIDGDSGFSGVNARLDAGQLPTGGVSSAKNIRFRNGVVSPRGGIKKVYWANDTLTNVGASDTSNGNHESDALFSLGSAARTLKSKPLTAFSNIRGVGRFDNPTNGISWLLVATSTTIYGIRENNEILKLQVGLTIPENVEFVQCFNVVVMFRGKDSTPLVMENRGDGFHEVTNPITQFAFSAAAVVNSTITLISTNETSKTYIAKASGGGVDNGDLDGSNVIFLSGSSASDSATNLKTAIESANGHDGQLLVTANSARVVIAQFQAGDAGKTDIATASNFTNSTNPNPDSAFSGGQFNSDVTLDENDTDGTESIPNADTGIYFQNRLLIPHSRDLVAVSDYLNYTRYQPVLSNFRINQGSEDKLVALVKYDQSTVICFKEHSVYAVRNIYGNLVDTYLDELTRTSGLIGKKAVTTVGKDVWYLSDQRGVVSLSVSESGKLQGLDVPISEAIQPLIDRINWKAATNAVAAYHNNRYYLAVPIDGAAKNNAVFVFDFKNKAWSGYDQSDQIGKAGSCSTAAYKNERTCVLGSGTWTAETGILDMFTFSYLGAERLFFLTTDGFISLYDDDMYSGDTDEGVDTANTSTRNITQTNISTEAVTRGYSFNSIDFKQFTQADFQLATNGVVGATGITLTAQFDGVSENSSVLTNEDGTTKYINFSRTKYDKPFDKADFVESNAGDDYMTQFRQDYSTVLSTALDPNTTGFNPDAKQESTQKARFNGRGRFVQFKVTNDLGICEIKGIKASALPGQTMVTKRI